MIQVDAQTMREVAPHFSGELFLRQDAIISAVGAVLAETLESYRIDSRLRIAHFLGQTCHESAGFRTTEEFASGERYEGRADLGNDQPGDGPRYKGRGLLQLTGRANYRELGAILGVGLEQDPELAAEPVLSLKIACEYWKRRKINAACDRDDIVEVTKLVNGGSNGLEDRRRYTTKAKTAIARLEGFVLAGEALPAAAPCPQTRLERRCGHRAATRLAQARLHARRRRRLRPRHRGRGGGIPEREPARRRRHRRQRHLGRAGQGARGAQKVVWRL
jgi:putative chitinase